MKRKRNLTKDPLKPFPVPNPKSRPVHKATVLALKVRNEQDRQHPEPMTLMHKREKNGEIVENRIKGNIPPGPIAKAARAMADWDNSDPFSYGRTALHVSQGYIAPDDIVAEMTHRTIARQAAKRREVDNVKSHG